MPKTDWMSTARQRAHRERNAAVKMGALWFFSQVMAAVSRKTRKQPTSSVISGSITLTKPNGPVFQTAHDQHVSHQTVNRQRLDHRQRPLLQPQSDWVGQGCIAK